MKYEIIKNDPALKYPEFLALELECFDEPVSEPLFSDFVAGDYWTARSDGVLAGFAKVKVHSNWVHLGRLEVCGKFRHAGIGGALIDSVIGFADEKNIPVVTLTVRENNTPAYALYTKKGFMTAGKRNNRYAIPVGNLTNTSPYEFVFEGEGKNAVASIRDGGVEIGSGRFNYEIGGCRDFVFTEPEKHLIDVLASIKPHLKPGSEYLYIMTCDDNVIKTMRTLLHVEETVFTDMELRIN